MSLKQLQHYKAAFDLNQQQLRKCYLAFLLELQRGLEMHARDPTSYRPSESSLMMLDSCVDVIPTGREKGVFYAINFGGTNIRALSCTFDGQGHISCKSSTHNVRSTHVSDELPKGLLDKRATASMLFDEIASVIERLSNQEKSSKKMQHGLGFTFSFAANQKAVNSARLMGWSKDFETGNETDDPVVGQDVGALLDMALARKKVNAKTTVVLNDTVGCLLAGAFSKKLTEPPCLVGVILGTGVNGAYVQRDAKAYGYTGIIINTELGNFNKELPRNNIDFEIDYMSPNRGRAHLEKMVSGMYIPEISRLLILRVFQHVVPDNVWVPFSLSGEACSKIFNDPQSVAEVIKNEYSWEIQDSKHCEIIFELIECAYRRSAAISAVTIAAMSRATGSLQPAMGGITVGIDGTVYVKNPKYQDMIKAYLSVILDEQTANLMNIVIADDGSGKGAAILAAAIQTKHSKKV